MTVQKQVSMIQEKEVAKKLGGKVTPASGGTKFDGGDVVVNDLLLECKTVTKDQTSFSVKKEWLDKVKEQSFEQGCDLSALAFRFGPNQLDYVVIDIDTFNELLSAYYKELQRELEGEQ